MALHRRRRLFASQQLGSLLEARGVVLRAEDEQAEPLPLDTFDDETLETRPPAEWMRLAAQQRGELLGAHGLAVAAHPHPLAAVAAYTPGLLVDRLPIHRELGEDEHLAKMFVADVVVGHDFEDVVLVLDVPVQTVL